ncbi:adenylate kinase [Gracilaria domingensis]|nr:adenylate kinase [Gracilaria domingensis]
MISFLSPAPFRLHRRFPISRRVCALCATAPSVSRRATLPVSNPPVFFVLGGPGSGKGTQCTLLRRDFDLAQVCVGDLLRKEAKNDTPLGKSVADTMQRGDIVPGHVTMGLLRDELQKLAGTCDGVLIDGFPRAMDQAEEFERVIATCEFVLFINCSTTVMVERLLKRATTSGRSDDAEEVVRKRLKTFENKTMPVVEHYRNKGMLYVIESDVGDIEQVYQQTKQVFESVFPRRAL